MPTLHPTTRKLLEKAVIRARDEAEAGAREALMRLKLTQPEPPGLTDLERDLRGLLETELQRLADEPGSATSDKAFDRLVEESAYEHWHRILFARFLAENNLLMHPTEAVPVTLADCRDLARDEGEPDAWMLAARYAQKMLPGIFRNDDAILKLDLAPERRQALQKIASDLPTEVFSSDDALGWVYQFWQSKRKEQVNKSGDKVSGDQICAVTQLFTEHYMVQFLLHNTLGAWWMNRHPGEPLPIPMEYLRVKDDGTPAAGGFEGWPNHAAEIRIMDPCCGSGHFLVAAFEIMVAFRMAEEGLDPAAAGDAVILDNLYGLEIDPRCTQIASFNLILAAWKRNGHRMSVPTPMIACSGLAVGGSSADWQRLGKHSGNLQAALMQLREWFVNARDLGSLINPTGDGKKKSVVTIETVISSLRNALDLFSQESDPAASVLGPSAASMARAAEMMSARYELVCTNVPYLKSGKQGEVLYNFIETQYTHSRFDLATAFADRCLQFCSPGGSVSIVCPQNWLFQTAYADFRRSLLRTTEWAIISRLGSGAFETISGEVVKAALYCTTLTTPDADAQFCLIDVSDQPTPSGKAELLRAGQMSMANQAEQLANPDARVVAGAVIGTDLLQRNARANGGMRTGDLPRFIRCFWEPPGLSGGWICQQSTVKTTRHFGGMEHIVLWEDGRGSYYNFVLDQADAGYHSGIWKAGDQVWGKKGVLVSQIGRLPVTMYTGEAFDNNTSAIVPSLPQHLPAIWCFCASPEFNSAVRRIDQKLNVTNATLVKVPFDLEYWQEVASKRYANGLPEPYSDDPTQWLFHGHPAKSTSPLQVALARLLGYRWPEHGLPPTDSGKIRQEEDGLNRFGDSDGIVCLPTILGEPPAAEQLREVLAAAYGEDWSQDTLERLLAESVGAASLDEWLRNSAFEQHCRLFHNRPFLWHIWDGHRNGFSAIVNHHKLTSQNLDKLIYSYLGSWITTQRAAAERKEPGATDRLVAAVRLQEKLQLIADGEPPYDIFVRWKRLHELPIGWDPDLNDGVRMNIRPFVEAGVLRSKFTIHWNKDRGKNPDGSERHNGLHFTRAEKQAARDAHRAKSMQSLSDATDRLLASSTEAVAGETDLFGVPEQKDLFGEVVIRDGKQRRG